MKVKDVCPECGDTTRCCEHVCQQCDEIGWTCTNGFCEDCCAENDCDGVNEEEAASA